MACSKWLVFNQEMTEKENSLQNKTSIKVDKNDKSKSEVYFFLTSRAVQASRDKSLFSRNSCAI